MARVTLRSLFLLALAAAPRLARSQEPVDPTIADRLTPEAAYRDRKLPKPGTPAWEDERAALLQLRETHPAIARDRWEWLVFEADDRWDVWKWDLVGGAASQRDYDGDYLSDWKDLCPSLKDDFFPDAFDDDFGDGFDGCPDNGRPETYRPGDAARFANGEITGYGEQPWTDPPAHARLVEAYEAYQRREPDQTQAALDAARAAGAHERLVHWMQMNIDATRRALASEAAEAAAAKPAPSAPEPPAPLPKPAEPVAARVAEPAARPALPSVDARLPSGKRSPGDAAVVVGIADYLRLPDVPYADRDAEAFRTWLIYTRGVPLDRVQVLTSPASRDHIRDAVARAGQSVGPGGTVWVYFAGHGAADPGSGARLVLGDDASADVTGFATRGLTVGELEDLAAAGGGRATLLLDACFTGVGRGGAELLAGKRFAVPTYATTRQAEAVQWNAASPGETAGPLDEVGHGAFTYWVVGALRGWADGELDGVRDSRVTGEEAHAYVTRALRALQLRDQQPVWLGPSDVALAEGVSEQGPPLE